MSLLFMKNINKAFYGKSALKNASIKVDSGEIHALLGENGAGKTTLMNVLYGLYQKDSGDIYWKDKLVDFQSPKNAIDYKIGMVHQHFMLVSNLTVAENITLGLKSKGHPFPDKKYLNEEIRKISEKYELEVNPEALISTLSVGEQQRVEILKLLYRDAKLLILDEPTAVLTPNEINNFFKILSKLKSLGHSVIIITHKIPEVLAITDKVTVLRDGESITTVNTKEVTNKDLAEFMIGRQLKEISSRERNISKINNNNKGLNIIDVEFYHNQKPKLINLNLNILPGQIVGIAGVDGNGQKDLAEIILGIKKHSRGTIKLNDYILNELNVKQRKNHGIAYISDDRHHDGLLMKMNLTENLLLRSNLSSDVQKCGFLKSSSILDTTKTVIKEYDIKTPGINIPINYLSGGNQQKLIIAREFSGNPILIVAFQPTRGLDIGATEFIQQKLLEKRSQGCSILLISADLDEIRNLSDRIIVMYKGEFLGELDNKINLDMTRLGMLMAGNRDIEKEGN